MNPCRWSGLALVVLAALAAAGVSAAAPDVPPPPPTATRPAALTVLGDPTYFRTHLTWRLPAVGTATKAEEGKMPGFRWIHSDFTEPTPLPPTDWSQPAFDDSGWLHRRAPIGPNRGEGAHTCLALLAARTSFAVTDPAKVTGLELAVAYHGGLVVTLNGKEIARQHLPAGTLQPLTLAEDYPRAAFATADGKLLGELSPRQPIPKALAENYAQRLRRLGVRIPADALVKGPNVLALEVHRTALPADLPKGRLGWETASLLGVTLTASPGSAIQGSTEPPADLQVFNAPPHEVPGVHVLFANPSEPLRPLRLATPRNGTTSAQLVVSGPTTLPAFTASVTDLQGPAGRIPAASLRVRYGNARTSVVPLLDQPPADAAITPVWLTAKTLKTTPAGTYTGSLTLAGLPRPVSVPVELHVYGWQLGDPGQWQTSVQLMQSPQCVAGRYNVPLWSDKHFALLPKSFALMGQLGNDVLSVNVVAKTLFGDDPVVVFRQDQGKWHPELDLLRRYLTLYGQNAAPPRFLSLQVWHYGLHYDGKRRDGTKKDYTGPYPLYAKTVPILERRGSDLVPAEMPAYAEPGTDETWKALLDGTQDLLRQLGWQRTRIVLGTSGDEWPGDRQIAFFKSIAPQIGWRVATHGSSVGKWGTTPEERTQGNGMLVDYANMVRRNIWTRPKAPGAIVACIARDTIGTSNWDFLGISPLATVAANYDGFGWLCVDHWPYDGPDGKSHIGFGEYTSFGNIMPGRFTVLSVPGPDGAVPTSQFELLREGIQLTEAMLFIRQALADPAQRQKLPDPVAAKARDAVQAACDTLESGRRISPQGSGDTCAQIRAVYQAAEDVATALGN